MTTRRTIGISTPAADAAGARILYLLPASRSSLDAGTRRVTRTATLDGGAVTYDAGYSVSDLTWSLSVRATSVTIGAFLAYLVKTYSLIRIATDAGVFDASPRAWRVEDGQATLEALVMEQIA